MRSDAPRDVLLPQRHRVVLHDPRGQRVGADAEGEEGSRVRYERVDLRGEPRSSRDGQRPGRDLQAEWQSGAGRDEDLAQCLACVRRQIPLRQATTVRGGQVIHAEAGQPGRPPQQLRGHEAHRQVREVRRAQRDRARIPRRRESRRYDARQRVTAVVPDEDRPRPGPGGQRVVEVRQPLVEVEQVVRDPLPEQHRDIQLAALRHVPRRPVVREERIKIAPGLPCRPAAGRDQLHERRRHRGRQVGAAAGEEDREPERPRGLLRREALLEIPPGDLGRERVEPGPPAVPQLGERTGELVPATVRPADRPDQRITRPLLRHPVQTGDEVDELHHVAALVVRVHHVRDAGALAEAALVEAQYAEAGVEPGLERGRVLGPAAAPAMTVEDQWHGVCGRGAGGLEQRITDPDRCRRTGLRHRGDTAVGDRDGGRGRDRERRAENDKRTNQ